MAIDRSAFPLDARIQLLSDAGELRITGRDGRDRAWAQGERDWSQETLNVYADRGTRQLLFSISGANRSHRETEEEISGADGRMLGTFIYRTASALTKARFDVFSGARDKRTLRFVIEERSALLRWVRNLSEDQPWLDFLQGFVLNPTYDMRLASGGSTIARIKKMPSTLETHFRIELTGVIPKADHDLALAALINAIAHESASD
ncbi:hypothetical protein [Ottowia testudinis]|uniref:Uncharacterized protein n=1 Tax=Ottowia testudinis TaxID=2816950 RepID=A0A975H2C6_9BURK|nr:hypothetical protein [Ottowia testudinis]QTD44659.1 hypothetical protein J1M35_16440 [Ottowia testudinis]